MIPGGRGYIVYVTVIAPFTKYLSDHCLDYSRGYANGLLVFLSIPLGPVKVFQFHDRMCPLVDLIHTEALMFAPRISQLSSAYSCLSFVQLGKR